MRRFVILLVFVLAACGAPVRPQYVSDAVCVDNRYVRVPDLMCPIGDDAFPGHPFHWSYHEYQIGMQQPYVMPYVGYPVERRYFADTRPARVTTININRGSFAERPPAGQSGAGSLTRPKGYVDTTRYVDKGKVVAAGTDVKRGGLGSTSVVPRDTKKVVNAGGGSTPPRSTPPPASSRPMSRSR